MSNKRLLDFTRRIFKKVREISKTVRSNVGKRITEIFKRKKDVEKKVKVKELRKQEEVFERRIDSLEKEVKTRAIRARYRDKELEKFVGDSYKQFLGYANQLGYVVLNENALKNILYRNKIFKLITKDVFLEIIQKVFSRKKQKILAKRSDLVCFNYVKYYSELFLNEFITQLRLGGGNSILVAKENSYSNTTKYPLNPHGNPADFKLYIFSSNSPFLKLSNGMFYVKHEQDFSYFSVFDKEIVMTNRFTKRSYRVNAIEYLKMEQQKRVVYNDVDKRRFFATAFGLFARRNKGVATKATKSMREQNKNLRFVLKKQYLNSIGIERHSVYRQRDLVGDFVKIFSRRHSSEKNFRDCIKIRYIKEDLKVVFYPKLVRR